MKKEHIELHQKFVKYGTNAKEWIRKCALLLPQIERERIWEQKGFESIYVYAAKLAGMGRDQVNDALRILEKTKDMPAIQKVIEAKGLNIIKPLVTILTAENETFWAEKAQTMSKNTLEMYVREMKKQTDLNLDNEIDKNQVGLFETKNEGFGLPRKEFDKRMIMMQLDPETADQLEKLKGEGDWNDLMKEFLQLRAEKLEQEKPETVETESRHIPAKIRKHVLARSKGLCEFPNCTKPYEILHHTDRFSLKKAHDPHHIIALCKAHERIVHQGLVEDESLPAKDWKILKHANQENPKFVVDQLVQKYRNFA